ncbi:MAG: hypothetical protein J1F37_05175 [Oscillospiraceae bacterium]|nr:hypothetical protein [Oscillospiraceae bacterium]
MHWVIIIGIIIAIIYGIYSFKNNASDSTKAIIFLLIAAAVFAIIATFAFKTVFGFLWKASLIIAGLLFLYNIFTKFFE